MHSSLFVLVKRLYLVVKLSGVFKLCDIAITSKRRDRVRDTSACIWGPDFSSGLEQDPGIEWIEDSKQSW